MATPGPTQPITLGPEGDQWRYDRSTRTYDLTRGQGTPAPLRIRTTAGPAAALGTHIAVAPALTALVVVDMQNFFLHERCRDHPTGRAAVDHTVRVVEACRRAGVQIIWLNWGLTDADLSLMPAAVMRSFASSWLEKDGDSSPRSGLGVDLGDGKGRCLVSGSWNAELYGPLLDASAPAPAPGPGGDVFCAKNRVSGMWDESQPLMRLLRRRRVRTLLFAGVNTDQCVLGTLVDAYNKGWDCVLLSDCCGTTTPGGKEVVEWDVAMCYGFVTDSEAFITATRQVSSGV